MTDERKSDEMELATGKASRRALLRLGAIAAPAVVTLRPAWASGGYHGGGGGGGGGATTSLAMCQIPIDKVCDKDGKGYDAYGYDMDSVDDEGMVAYGGGGYDDKGKDKDKGKGKCYAPPPKGYYYGQELIDYEASGKLPDGIYDKKQFDAHLKYIKNLKPGKDGFTCLTSLVHKL
ncbi:hypothetical protein [Sphingosinicella soli]|uniref:Uncharacterized protein n=1 Tax=Sphingosinicella soli TaxID=333708 RepID=A0A7W7B343_9SPHN|nr:hypothetical protein [Sphingosinicella soli]MBB4632999.1 hypothetical protein [Sphingosinicella soli]